MEVPVGEEDEGTISLPPSAAFLKTTAPPTTHVKPRKNKKKTKRKTATARGTAAAFSASEASPAPWRPAKLPPCLDDSHEQGPARCAVYVKRELLQAEVPVADLVGGPFECCAVRIRLDGGDTTVASVYIRPQQPWDPRCLRQLAHRLGREFLLCGDVNAHHPAWGGRRTDPRGREVRDVLQQLGLVILNTGADTFVRRGRQATSTAIDLSVATEGCRYSWSPLPDTWGVGPPAHPAVPPSEARPPGTESTAW
ncbi:hypothetical protein MTO96_038460 [Rhipicephalus appendiculatus]